MVCKTYQVVNMYEIIDARIDEKRYALQFTPYNTCILNTKTLDLLHQIRRLRRRRRRRRRH